MRRYHGTQDASAYVRRCGDGFTIRPIQHLANNVFGMVGTLSGGTVYYSVHGAPRRTWVLHTPLGDTSSVSARATGTVTSMLIVNAMSAYICVWQRARPAYPT